MRLTEIFEKSLGLTHAERNFYLAFCTFADNKTGFCWPKRKSVGKRPGFRRKVVHVYIRNWSDAIFCERSQMGIPV